LAGLTGKYRHPKLPLHRVRSLSVTSRVHDGNKQDFRYAVAVQVVALQELRPLINRSGDVGRPEAAARLSGEGHERTKWRTGSVITIGTPDISTTVYQ